MSVYPDSEDDQIDPVDAAPEADFQSAPEPVERQPKFARPAYRAAPVAGGRGNRAPVGRNYTGASGFDIPGNIAAENAYADRENARLDAADERARQVADAANAKATDSWNKKNAAAQLEDKMIQQGLDYYKGEDGQLRPKRDEAGNVLYKQGDWAKAQQADGSWAHQRRGKNGKAETKRATIISNDNTDPNLYYDFGTDGREVAGHVDDLVNSKDPEVALVAAKHRSQWATEQRKAAMKPLENQVLGMEQERDAVTVQTGDIANQQAALGARRAELQAKQDELKAAGKWSLGFLSGGGLTSDAETIKAQQDQLDAQDAELAQKSATLNDPWSTKKDMVGPKATQLASLKAEHDAWKNEAKISAYADVADERRAVLKKLGRSEKDDPILKEIGKVQAQFGARTSGQVAAAAEAKRQSENPFNATLGDMADPYIVASPEERSKFEIRSKAKASLARTQAEMAKPDVPVTFGGEMARRATDMVSSFGAGSNSLLKMAGDLYGVVTGDFDNVASEFGKHGVEYFNEMKSPELAAAEKARSAAINSKTGVFDQALAWVSSTFSNPELAINAFAEQVPNTVGSGGAGALIGKGGAALVLRNVTGAAAAKMAARVAVATQVGTGAMLQGADVAGDQHEEMVASLGKMPDADAMAIPEIGAAVKAGHSLEEAKLALALSLARKTFFSAAGASAVMQGLPQFIPGLPTLEKTLAGGAKGVAGLAKGAARTGVAMITEGGTEMGEEGVGLAAKNKLAQTVDPTREVTKGLGETLAQSGVIGAAGGGLTALDAQPVPPVVERAPVNRGKVAAMLAGEDANKIAALFGGREVILKAVAAYNATPTDEAQAGNVEALALRMEQAQKAQAQIAAIPDFAPDFKADEDPNVVAAESLKVKSANRDAASALVKLTNGVRAELLTEGEQQGLQLVGEKIGTGMVEVIDGVPVITDKAATWLKDSAPAASALIGRSEGEMRAALAERATAVEAAKPAAPAAAASPVAADPVPVAPAVVDPAPVDPVAPAGAAAPVENKLTLTPADQSGPVAPARVLKAFARLDSALTGSKVSDGARVVMAKQTAARVNRMLSVFKPIFGDVAIHDGANNSGGYTVSADGKLNVWLGDITHNQNAEGLVSDERLATLFSEEAAHVVSLKLAARGKWNPGEAWGKLSGEEQALFSQAYLRDQSGKPTTQAADGSQNVQMAHEMVRMFVQGRAQFSQDGKIIVDGKTTEQTASRGLLEVLKDVFSKIQAFLSGEAGKTDSAGVQEMRAVADRIGATLQQALGAENFAYGDARSTASNTLSEKQTTTSDRPAADGGAVATPAPISTISDVPATEAQVDKPIPGSSPVAAPAIDSNNVNLSLGGAQEGETGPVSAIQTDESGNLTAESRQALAAELGVHPEQLGNVESVTHKGRVFHTVNVVAGAEQFPTSHNPDGTVRAAYPQDLQPRDRSGDVYLAQQRQMAQKPNLNEEMLKGTTDRGVPIVALVGGAPVVVMGNGRANAKALMYQSPALAPVAQQFAANVAQVAQSKGLASEVVSSVEKPTLYRVALDAMPVSELREASQESNEFGGAATNSVEQARQDAGRLSPTVLAFLDSEFDISASRNTPFRQEFVRHVIGSSAANIKEGDLNRRIEAALFAKAYSGSAEGAQAFSRLVNEADTGVKALIGAMMEVAPQVSAMNTSIEDGSLHPLAISQDVARAVQDIAVTLKDKPSSQSTDVALDGLVNQQEMAGISDRTPLQDSVLRFLVKSRANKAKIGEALRNYINLVRAEGDPKQGSMFGDVVPRSTEQLWNDAVSLSGDQVLASTRASAAKRINHVFELSSGRAATAENGNYDYSIQYRYGVGSKPHPNFPDGAWYLVDSDNTPIRFIGEKGATNSDLMEEAVALLEINYGDDDKFDFESMKDVEKALTSLIRPLGNAAATPAKDLARLRTALEDKLRAVSIREVRISATLDSLSIPNSEYQRDVLLMVTQSYPNAIVDAAQEYVDFVNLYGAPSRLDAVRSVPAQSTHKPAVKNPAFPRVASFFKTIAEQDSAWQFGREKTSSKDIQNIAGQFNTDKIRVKANFDSANQFGKVETFTPSGQRIGGITFTLGGNSTISVGATGANSNEKADNGGKNMYQALFTWARNNGYKVKGSSLSPINRVRRTVNMLSSALRHDTTDHLIPDNDQELIGWINGDTENNIGAMVAALSKQMSARTNGAVDKYVYNPRVDAVVNQVTGEMITKNGMDEIITNGKFYKEGFGPATVRAILAARAELVGHTMGLDSNDEAGASAANGGTLEGMLYSSRARRGGDESLDMFGALGLTDTVKTYAESLPAAVKESAAEIVKQVAKDIPALQGNLAAAKEIAKVAAPEFFTTEEVDSTESEDEDAPTDSFSVKSDDSAIDEEWAQEKAQELDNNPDVEESVVNDGGRATEVAPMEQSEIRAHEAKFTQKYGPDSGMQPENLFEKYRPAAERMAATRYANIPGANKAELMQQARLVLYEAITGVSAFTQKGGNKKWSDYGVGKKEGTKRTFWQYAGNILRRRLATMFTENVKDVSGKVSLDAGKVGPVGETGNGGYSFDDSNSEGGGTIGDYMESDDNVAEQVAREEVRSKSVKKAKDVMRSAMAIMSEREVKALMIEMTHIDDGVYGGKLQKVMDATGVNSPQSAANLIKAAVKNLKQILDERGFSMADLSLSSGRAMFDMGDRPQDRVKRDMETIQSVPNPGKSIRGAVEYSGSKGRWIIPKFQGAKQAIVPHTLKFIDDMFSLAQQAKVETIFEGFGGSGSYGQVLALERFPNLKKLIISEFDKGRFEKIRYLHAFGDRWMSDFESTGLRTLVERLVGDSDSLAMSVKSGKPVDSAGGIKGRLEQAINRAEPELEAIIEQYGSDEMLAKNGGINIAEALVHSLIDFGSAERGARLFAGKLYPWIASDAAAAKRQNDALGKKGVSVEYHNGSTFDLVNDPAIALGDNSIFLADPPYYHTTGYAPGPFVTDDHWNAKGYEQVANMLASAKERGASVIYNDEAWGMRDDVQSETGALADTNAAEKTWAQIRGLFPDMRVAKAGKRLETLAVLNQFKPDENSGRTIGRASGDDVSNRAASIGTGGSEGGSRQAAQPAAVVGAKPAVAQPVTKRAEPVAAESLLTASEQEMIDQLSVLLRDTVPASLKEIQANQSFETDGTRTQGRPELANPGNDEASRNLFNAIDEARKATATVQNQGDVRKEAARIIAADRVGTLRAMLDKASKGGAFANAIENEISTQLVRDLVSKGAMGDVQAMEQAEILGVAHRAARSETARTLAIGHDSEKTPAERLKDFMANALWRVNPKARQSMEGLWTRAEQLRAVDKLKAEISKLQAKTALVSPVAPEAAADNAQLARLRAQLGEAMQKATKESVELAAIKERIKKVEKAMPGVTLDHIMNGEAYFRLIGDNFSKNAVDSFAANASDRLIVNRIRKGQDNAYIAKGMGLSVDLVAKVRSTYLAEVERRLRTIGDEALNPDNFDTGELKSGTSGKLSEEERNQRIATIMARMGAISDDVAKLRTQKGVARNERKAKEQKRQALTPMPEGAVPGSVQAPATNGKAGTLQNDAADARKAPGAVPAYPADATGKTPVDNGNKQLGLGEDVEAMPPVFDPTSLHDAASVARAMQAADSNKFDMLYEAWINGILSGPMTQAANVSGNAFNAGWDMGPKRFGEAVVNLAVRDKNAPQMGEFKWMMLGLQPAFAQAWKDAVSTFDTEVSNFGLDTLEQQLEIPEVFDKSGGIQKAIPGQTGRIVRLPGRLLMAADAFFKTSIAHLHVATEAYRAGMAQGLKGEALAKFIETESKMGSVSWGKAMALATELTFQDDHKGTAMGELLQGITSLREWDAGKGIKPLRFIAPFIRTPFNIFQQGLRQSPAGAIMLAARIGNGLYGTRNGKPFAESYPTPLAIKHSVEQLMAWAIVGALYGAAAGDEDDADKKILITGSITDKRSGVSQLNQRAGMDAYVMRIGGAQIKYGRIEPLATMLGTAVDMITALKGGNGAFDSFGNFLASAGAAADEKTFLRGWTELSNALSGETKLKGYVAQQIATAVPNLFKQPVRNLDPVVRQRGTGFLDTLAGSVYAPSANPKIDVYGKEIEKAGVGAARLTIPAEMRSVPEIARVDKLLLNYNAGLTPEERKRDGWAPEAPSRKFKVNGKAIELGADDYEKYSRKTGEIAVRLLAGASLNVSKPTKRDIDKVKTAFGMARAQARRQFFGAGAVEE